MQQSDESSLIMERISQRTKNLWARCVGLSARSDKLVRIKLKERELKERKKAFGIQYMELEQKSSVSEQELRDCIQRAKSSLAVLEQEIVELKIEIACVEEKTQRKIQKRSSERTNQPKPPSPLDHASTGVLFPDVFVERNPFDTPASPSDDFVVVSAQVEPSAPSEQELLYGDMSKCSVVYGVSE